MIHIKSDYFSLSKKTYPNLHGVYKGMPVKLRNEIAIALRLIGKKEVSKIYGMSETLSVSIFHPVFYSPLWYAMPMEEEEPL